MLPDAIKKFTDIFSKLPSIGPRQAMRLAFYISNLGKGKIKEISQAITGLAGLADCSRCFRTFTPLIESEDSSESERPTAGRSGNLKLCSICADPMRMKNLIAIAEKETDILSLEKTKKFNGWYLLLGELHKIGELEPEQKLRLSSLKNFIKKELGNPSTNSGQAKADEIILAINPTVYGDLNASFLKRELEGSVEKITRLGRGIPTGGEIEFADEETLGQALEKRS